MEKAAWKLVSDVLEGIKIFFRNFELTMSISDYVIFGYNKYVKNSSTTSNNKFKRNRNLFCV